MLRFEYNNEFSFYFLDESGQRIPAAEWKNLEDEYLSQLSILQELRDNGNAKIIHYTCVADTLEILSLSDIDKQILGLPDEYPYDIYIESDGQLNQMTFQFKYGFFDFAPNGTRFMADRNGPILNIGDTEYLLSKNQFEICEELDVFNQLPEQERTFHTNLSRFADIKSLSKDIATTLDQYLDGQEIYSPDKIKIDAQFQNGILEIIPHVGIENESGFINTYDKWPTARDMYAVSDGQGKTTRIVLTEEQKKEFQNIKQLRKITNEETIQQIIEHPEEFFDSEESDFSVFYSERVKEIGVYKPRFYPFVCPYKSEWIPGIVVKDKVDGEKRVYFKTPDKLNAFIEEKEHAVRNDKKMVQWEDIEIPIEEADKLIQNARKQFENPKEPIKPTNRENDSQVLIIKENAELTEFVQNTIAPDSIVHQFSEINNLSPEISLKTHQKEGISWLQSMYRKNVSGCLLADDMGLGKTLQLLYFIEWHRQQFPDKNMPYLIVAPVSLLENWENEYLKFFTPKTLSITKLYGTIPLTKGFDKQINRNEAKTLEGHHIILTNYETVRNYQATLCLVDFGAVVLDEAQKVKTPGTLVTNACKALKSDFKIAMTGTPVENTLIDIWCIMDFAAPGLLGNAKDFAKDYQNPLKDEDTNVKELTEGLREKIGVFIKRRLKRDVAKDLPRKYDNANSRIKKVMPRAQLERYKVEIEEVNSSHTGDEEKNRKLRALWAVRDISDHPYLLDNQIQKFTSEELIATSAKLQTTVGILHEIKLQSDKAIVFADRKATQKMLQKVIYDTFRIFPSIINGDTPSTQKRENAVKLSRQQTIDRFQDQEGFNIIIMSPLAAGVGLNVTEANHVIHYSRHWNPAKEEQATDRAYRIGQEKDVYVYYPMAVFPDEMMDEKGEKLKSFDEILDNLLNHKKALATHTLFPTERTEVRPDELFGNIFGIDPGAHAEILEINHLDKLNPNLFEAAIGTMYEQQGYQVHLTPYSNDKGVDVVLLNGENNFLLQVKQTRSLVGREAIQEIVTAQKYYENKFKVKFQLKAVTNNDFSGTARLLGNANGVTLIDRSQLSEMTQKNPFTIREINRLESQRLQRI